MLRTNEAMIRRTPLLLEADWTARRSERGTIASPGDAHSHRRHAALLRRQGNPGEAEHHDRQAAYLERVESEPDFRELHSIGSKRADVIADIDRERQDYFEKHHAWRRTGDPEKRAQMVAANDRWKEKISQLHDLSADWQELAERVHARGVNPALTLHRAHTEDANEHANTLMRVIAGLNDVSAHHDEPTDDWGRDAGHRVPVDGVRFVSYGSTGERRLANLNRAATQAHEAMLHHHPDSNPHIVGHPEQAPDPHQRYVRYW